jgi:hypothetical protein
MSSSSGVSEHASFPTIILCHVTPHYLCFHYVPSKPFCLSCLSLFACLFSIPTAPSVFVFPINRLLLSTCHPHPLLYFHPQLLPNPLSMYIVVVVVFHSRSLLPPLALSPPCFISPFFIAVHEMGCMYDDVCLSPLCWKLGKKGKLSSMRAPCSDSFAFALAL